MATRKTAAPATKARAKPGPKPKVDAPVSHADLEAPPPASVPPAAAARRTFQFDLAEEVTITASNETGEIRARAEWVTGNCSYLLAYTSARGEFGERWIDEDLLTGSL